MCLRYEFNFDLISEIHFQEKYKTVSSVYNGNITEVEDIR